MAKSVSKNDIQNMSEDWGLDPSNGLPYSGAAVQKFIKKTFSSKMGYFHYDTSSNRYLVFADEESKDKYVENPTMTALVLGTFDAPFNYEASINMLTPSYNAVFLGSTGNYLDFTFDIKNKQGNSTGENVTVTYTFIRNATKQVVTETRRYGESVHFNIDEYILEGTNTIIVGVSGQTTLAATTAALTYQVVNLTYSDNMDISKVYNLSDGSKSLEIFLSVSGYGTKIIEWFLDGQQLDFVKSDDEVVDVTSERTKYIEISNLASGIHTIQSRAYTMINGEKFYTDTLYREFMVNNGDSTSNLVAVASNIPNSHGIVNESNPFVIYGVEQYIPYVVRFATRKTGNVSVYLASELLSVVNSIAGTESSYTITSNKSGTLALKFAVDNIEREIPVSVNQTSLNIEEIKTALSFDFRASGRSNLSVDKDKWSYEGYTGTFNGFNWNASSGWVDGSLLINSGASFSINIAPLANDATSTGKTLEFEFSTRNVENDDAVICDLTTNGKGLLITASEARLTSAAGEVVSTRFKAGEVNRIAFVINRKTGVTYKGLAFIYVNGILSGAVNYGSADNFLSSKELVFVGTDSAQVELRSMRFYDTALSAENIINNYILYRDSLNEMMEVYYRNDIYEEGTQTFSPDLMLHRLPVMVITGDIPTLEAATSTSTQILVDIDYTNEQDPTKNFKMKNAALRIQGTSSLAYPRKNFRFYTQKEASTMVYDADGKVIQNKLYSFKDGAQPVDCWCLKADFAESSGTHNTGIARLWNKAMYGAIIQHKNVLGVETNGYALRTNAQVAALAAGYPYDVRTTIDGFPIVLFYKKNASDTDLIFLGKYNFNNDKSTPSVFGFENIPGFNNARMQCWETKDNGHPLGLFTDISGFDANWREAFESRYPDTKNPYTTDLKNFSIWINGVSQSDFVTQKWSHFDVYKVAAYYCYLMRFGAVDQPVKNAFLTSEDGEKFFFINYDNDTINGLINTGRLALDPTVDRDTIGSDGEYVYAGHNSVLWNKLTNDAEFMEIVSIVDNALYSAGLRYDEVIAMFNDEQADKWVERVYNQDAEYKYLLPYVNQATNNLFMLQGSRSSHRSWWLSKRFSLYDSLFLSGAYRDRNISFKCLNDTQPNQKFSITAATSMNYGYGVNNGIRETGVELSVNESHTFSTTDTLNLGDVVKVFAASNLLEFNLSQMANRIAVLDCSASSDPSLGSKMKRLVLGGAGKVNTELSAISGINVLTSLQELNVEDYQNITTLNLTSQKDLRKVYAKGSGVASIDFATGAPVDHLELPSAMMALNFNQLPYLTFGGLVFESGLKNIHTLNIYGCPNLTNDFSFIQRWIGEKTMADISCTLAMDGVDWNNVSADDFISFSQRKKNGMNVELKGKVYLTSLTLEQASQLQEIWGDDCFDKNVDFRITAPDAIYILGPSEILEGFNGKFTAAVFSDYQGKVEWSIISGGTSYQSIDQYGLLTTRYQGSARTITIQAKHYPTQGAVVTITKQVSIIKQVRPTGGTISGSTVASNGSVYTLSVNPSNINTEYSVSWSLSGTAYNEGNVSISEQDSESCTIAVVGGKTGSFSLVATITNCAGETLTVTKNLELGIMVTVRMLSNQSGDTTLNNLSATYYLNGSSNGLSIKNGVGVSMPIGSPIKVTFPDVPGYAKPNDIEHVLGNENETFAGTYQTEILTVNVTSDINLPSSYTVTVSGIGSQTTASKIYKVPFGTSYTVSATAADGYSTPASQSFTANSVSRYVTVKYLEYVGPPVDLSMQDIFGNPTSQTTANCYVIKAKGTYMFPLVFGNAISGGTTNSAAFTKVSGTYSHDFVDYKDNVITTPYIETMSGTASGAELSMADTDNVFSSFSIVSGTGCRYIQFKVKSIPTTGANGVISVLDGSGTVMWSWHIWVWPDDLTPVTITNKTGVDYNILPVNLATKKDAITSGKMYNWFYQCGRSTPILPPKYYNSSTNATNYGTKVFAVSSDKAGTYGVGIQNPQMFYKSGSVPYNWFGAASYYNLWDANYVTTGNSDNNVMKTVYDPCPVGFKIPNGNTFTYFSKTNVVGSFSNGWYFKRNAGDTTGVFFPASGYRYYSNGSLNSVGSYGNVWLSSAGSQGGAYSLYFESSGVVPQYNIIRAYGCSVRPVQE